MKIRWAVRTIIVLAVSAVIGGQLISSAAQEGLSIPKKERFYSIKILEKLDEVLKKQGEILDEIKALKKAVGEGKKPQ